MELSGGIELSISLTGADIIALLHSVHNLPQFIEFLPALYHCGERILNLLHKLKAVGCDDIYTEDLEALSKEALQVLQQIICSHENLISLL